MTRSLVIATLVVLAAPSLGAPPPHRWNAAKPAPALVEVARAVAAKADFAQGYSQPKMSTEIVATDEVVETRTLVVSAFGDEESAYSFGNGQITFDAQSTDLSVNAAFVLHADGSVQTVAQNTVQSVEADNDVFGDTVTLVVPFAGLQPGSVAVLDYTRRERLGERVYPWGRIFYLQSGYPIDDVHIDISWTATRPLAWATDADRLNCAESDLSVVCNGGGYPAVARDEVVNFYDLLPHFSVAEKSTWADVYDVTRRVVERAQSGSHRVDVAFARLSDGADSRDDVVGRVHDFVAKQIRYVGLEQGEHGYVPHSTDETLERRFGDCKDMATLVIELLRKGKVVSRPVLVASDHERSAKLLIPNVAYFDHMVACLDGESPVCLDATDPYAPWRTLPSHLQGRVNLGISNDAVTSYPRERYLWTLKVATANAFSADGAVLERQTREFSGSWAGHMRGRLKARNVKDRTRLLVDDYESTIGDDGGKPDFEIDNLDALDSTLVVRSEKRYPKLVSGNNALDYTERLGWLMDLLDEAQNANREYAFEFDGFSYAEDTAFDPAGHWTLARDSVPILKFRSRFGEVDRTSDVDDGRLVVHTSVRLPQASIAPADLESFGRFVKAIRDNTHINVRGVLGAR